MKKTDDYVLRIISDIPLLICSGRPVADCWVYELNDIGRLLWDNCELYETMDDMVNNLDKLFSNPLSMEQKEMCKEFLNSLEEKGLIVYER